MKQISDQVINIGPVRFSYMSVFKPRLNTTKKVPVEEFSVALLIPKTPNTFCKDPEAELKGIRDNIVAAMNAKFGNKAEAMLKTDVWKNPLKNGDKEINKTTFEPKYPGYWFINCTAQKDYPPMLIDGAKNKVTEGWVSGDWGVAQIYLRGFDKDGGIGVGCYLRAIQFLKHDEPLGGGAGASADAFEEQEYDGPRVGATEGQAGEYDPFAE